MKSLSKEICLFDKFNRDLKPKLGQLLSFKVLNGLLDSLVNFSQTGCLSFCVILQVTTAVIFVASAGCPPPPPPPIVLFTNMGWGRGGSDPS